MSKLRLSNSEGVGLGKWWGLWGSLGRWRMVINRKS